ncbi:MAG: histidine phosphatase family protein [Blautia sp.]|nr:histidine phosphatase family protein [Blautia sp.]
MKIWVTRHGQTNLNKRKRMQGRIDEPLNEAGIRQARDAREKISHMTFDAVYASPLDRAITTASIIGNIPKEQVIVDSRILECDFGKYDCKSYFRMGPSMTLYWALPEVFPAPKSVESIASMVRRSVSFLREMESKDYQNVLIVCHGGIIRALCGYLEERNNGILWRPKPKNCEIRIYEYRNGKHRRLES